jgi:hypothetical protein
MWMATKTIRNYKGIVHYWVAGLFPEVRTAICGKPSRTPDQLFKPTREMKRCDSCLATMAVYEAYLSTRRRRNTTRLRQRKGSRLVIRKRRVRAMLLAIGVLAGCATPTPQERWADYTDDQLIVLLGEVYVRPRNCPTRAECETSYQEGPGDDDAEKKVNNSFGRMDCREQTCERDRHLFELRQTEIEAELARRQAARQ